MRVVVVEDTPKKRPIILDSGDYVIYQDPEDKFHYLLVPAQSNITPSPWLRSLTFIAKTDNLEELKFPDDVVEITSTSIPKFYNVEEIVGSPETDVVAPFFTLKSGEWITTTKFDGVQIIRYVFKDKVRFRTRGSSSVSSKGDKFVQKFVSMIEDKRLFDPDFLPDYVLIFEMVAKDFRIQVEYEDDFIAGIFALKKTGSNIPDKAFKILPPDEVVKLFSKIKGVKTYTPTHINIKEIKSFIEEIRDRWNYEGEVLYRVEDSEVKEIVKLKTKFFFTSKKLTFIKFLKAIWDHRPKNVKTVDIDWEEVLKSFLSSGKVDEEELIIIKAKRYIETFLNAIKGKKIRNQAEFMSLARTEREKSGYSSLFYK